MRYLHLLISLCLLLNAQPLCAGTLQTIAATNLHGEASVTPATILDANAGDEEEKLDVLIGVQVPHNLRSLDKLVAYPYPVRVPTNPNPIKPLETTAKSLKQSILNDGYTTRWHYRAYPMYGWRFENAMKAATEKSGLGQPHTMFEAYQWRNDMLKYLKPEVERINKEEEDRLARYDKAREFWDEQGTEIENDATRRGLEPVQIRTVRSLAKVQLAPGMWWITGTRKVPGLMYYWQLPVTVTPGTENTVKLTQANALMITGGW